MLLQILFRNEHRLKFLKKNNKINTGTSYWYQVCTGTFVVGRVVLVQPSTGTVTAFVYVRTLPGTDGTRDG